MVVAQREQLEPADRAGWRQWLAGHHDTSPGVWLVLHRKSAGPQPLTLEDAVEEALCFGWIDSTLRRLDERRNVLLFTPRMVGRQRETSCDPTRADRRDDQASCRRRANAAGFVGAT